MRGSDMEEGPDLSHLTPEERAIIESVMVRQKQEEEREQEIMRYYLPLRVLANINSRYAHLRGNLLILFYLIKYGHIKI